MSCSTRSDGGLREKMAASKIPGRERQPAAGAARSLLNTVKAPDFSKPSIKDPKAKDVIEKVV